MLKGECPFCKSGELQWKSDIDFEDVGQEGEGIVQFTVCTNRDIHIEAYIPKNNLK